MKKILLFILLLFAWNAVAVWADGDQRNHEPGTRWVDPVEFYELQDIGRTDFQRDYDQGDIDFSKVVKEKGLKVYGLKLKPFCGATFVEKFAHITELDDSNSKADFQFEFQDLYGVRGIPLHEASFCIYVDEGVSRSYDFTYKWKSHHGEISASGVTVCEHWENNTSTSTLNISNLRLSSTEKSLDVCYSFTGHEHIYEIYRNFCHRTDKKPDIEGTLENDYDFSKPDGANPKLGHFIYFKGARDLILMVGADAMSLAEYMKESEIPLLQRPWPRVYFFVEEILVEDDGGAILSEEDRQELVNYLEGLTAWLSGEGDPLGLGEHTDATTSAVIGAIGTIASILLGNGLAGMLGGGAGSLVDTLLNSATSGANPLPGSDAPDLTKMEGLKGRKPDEEEDKEEETPPSPPEEKLDFFDKYTRTDADGDIYVKDPVTGKETLYTNNGDGTYRNFNTDQNWRPDEINEQLRYRDENSNPLRQDAETAAKNAAEQHAQWEKESQELSKDGQEYLKWKHDQEAAERKQEQINKLAQKYGVPPTEKAVKNAIKYEQAINQIDANTYNDLANQYDEGINKLEIIDKTCEIGVNVMSTCVPGGEAVKDAYTFAKATLVAASEAVADGKSLGEGLAHIAVGAGNGALGVIQNQAGNLTEGKSYALLKEYGITVGTEGLKDGMTKYYETGDIGKAYSSTLNAIGKKSAEFGVSKGIGAVFGFVKDSAKQTLNPGSATIDTDTGFRFSNPNTAKTIDKWMNKSHTFHAGHRADVFKVKVDDAGKVSWGGKGQGFSIFYSGKIDTGKLAEGVVNETLNQSGVYDPAGKLASGLGNDVVNFAKDVKEFSNLAASFRNK